MGVAQSKSEPSHRTNLSNHESQPTPVVAEPSHAETENMAVEEVEGAEPSNVFVTRQNFTKVNGLRR
jgi:hypothetical protein